MKQPPTFDQFILRLGGSLTFVLIVSYTAKYYFPVYQAHAAVLAGFFCAIFLIFSDFRKIKKSIGNRNYRKLIKKKKIKRN